MPDITEPYKNGFGLGGEKSGREAGKNGGVKAIRPAPPAREGRARFLRESLGPTCHKTPQSSALNKRETGIPEP